MVAAQTLGVARRLCHGKAGDDGFSAGKRMRELSMLVHPDKCSLPGAEQVCFDPPLEGVEGNVWGQEEGACEGGLQLMRSKGVVTRGAGRGWGLGRGGGGCRGGEGLQLTRPNTIVT